MLSADEELSFANWSWKSFALTFLASWVGTLLIMPFFIKDSALLLGVAALPIAAVCGLLGGMFGRRAWTAIGHMLFGWQS